MFREKFLRFWLIEGDLRVKEINREVQPRTRVFPRTAYVSSRIGDRSHSWPFRAENSKPDANYGLLHILAERSFTDNSISIIKLRFHAMWISIEIVCILRSCTDRRRSCKKLFTISRLFPRRFRLHPQIFHKKGLKRDSRECFLVFLLPLLRFLGLCFLQKSSSMGHAIHKIKQAPLVVINVWYELWREFNFSPLMLYRQKKLSEFVCSLHENHLPGLRSVGEFKMTHLYSNFV